MPTLVQPTPIYRDPSRQAETKSTPAIPARSLWSRLGTKLLFPITCHPQMDGQTKVENWIPHVEFSFNRVFNSTTSYSPFELAYGFNLVPPLDLFPLPIMRNCVNGEGLSKA
ncbi:hypothetical protein CR513_20310, partial [Mucuna pruriens]